MSLFLDTRGLAWAGIGICDRCSRKFPIGELMPDPNYPGLRVCRVDVDELDPYRLPARQTERITLPFVRPDVSVATDPAGLISEDGNTFVTTDNFDDYVEP
jgi:hypothetical protein